MKLLSKPTVVNLLLWLAYAVTVCFTAAHHEPWRDEADTWLVTRDETLPYIFSRTGYMGTPVLWYAVVFPLAKLGLPYISMEILTVVIALVTVGLLIFLSPLNFWLKASITFSYLFLYEYSVLARSYGLSALLIVSLAALHHNRRSHAVLYGLLIALLANTNVHGLIVSIAVTAAFVLTGFRSEKSRQWIITVLIAGAGIIASIYQLIPPADGQLPAALSSEWYKQPVLSTFRGAFFPDLAYSVSRGYSSPSLNEKLGLVLKLFSFALIALILKKIWSNKFAVVTFVLSYGALFCLFAFKYYGSVRHWGFYVLVALFCLWISADKKESSVVASANEGSDKSLNYRALSLSGKIDLIASSCLFLTFVYASGVGIAACVMDVKQPFSYGKEVARQLKLLNKNNAPVVCAPNFALSALPELNGVRFYYPNINEFGTHALWNGAEKRDLTMKEVSSAVDEHFGRTQKLFVVTDKVSPDLVQDGFNCVFKSAVPPICLTEDFVIYERN